MILKMLLTFTCFALDITMVTESAGFFVRYSNKHGTIEQGSSSTHSGIEWYDCRPDAILLQEADLVGIDKPKSQLIQWLVDEDPQLKVISVAGMGGLGKTTLTRKVYDDATVKRRFQTHVWITVSETFKVEELLKDMIRQLFDEVMQPHPQGMDDVDTNSMKKTINDFLQQKRYVFVLDDVWGISAWQFFKIIFSECNCGSRIILTMRNFDLASFASKEYHGSIYALKPLPCEPSWDLFCKKAFQGNPCPSYLEDLSRDILKKCEGLPLAIVTIGGLLSTKENRLDEWERIYRSLGAELESNDKLMSINKILSLSYLDLLYYLKLCFLYLSIFPEDFFIEHMRLIRLWVAEGFVEVKEGMTKEEVAESVEDPLSVLSKVVTFGKGVRLLTVLDLRGTDLKTFPEEIVKLVHLTYLSLRKTKVRLIPKSIGNLKKLETLDLKLTRVTELPKEILKLQYLRHLLLSRDTSFGFHFKSGFKAPKGIGSLTSLQKLCFIEADNGSKNSIVLSELGKLTQLMRKLQILRLPQEDGKVLCSSLEKLNSLQSLFVGAEEEDEIIDLDSLSLAPRRLRTLYLKGRLQNLPHWIHSLHNLTRVCLWWSKLRDVDPLQSFQDLPNLVCLNLEEGYEGEGLCFKAGGFQRLKCLWLSRMKGLKWVRVEAGSMPLLEEARLLNCQSMKKLPLGIEHLANLKLLHLFGLSSLDNDLKGRDYEKIAHIPVVWGFGKKLKDDDL
ncbi:hypothetical protein RHMOL_Rhmol07G0161800 [Rhododendron molle]|uniref:Uncharacterized protein n=1 Tax=Rhododendron molle TaxID=49168 RepID=A0ACC0N1E7_RHOML|nr:hypothetical protein RHMOL_Rhmol07G0161800 [Rhododendron molle]